MKGKQTGLLYDRRQQHRVRQHILVSCLLAVTSYCDFGSDLVHELFIM